MNILNKIFGASKTLDQNNITINGVKYKLPTEVQTLNTVLNHLDMVKKGLKTHINFYDMEGNKVKLTSSYIKNSEVKINLIN